jgi:hypothetical protein
MSGKTQRAALSAGALAVIIAAAVAVTLLKDRCSSGGVECRPAGTSVQCRISLMTASDKPIRVCWEMKVTCRNGSSLNVPRCAVMRRSAPEKTVTVPLVTVPGPAPCDEARAVDVTNVTEKPLTL